MNNLNDILKASKDQLRAMSDKGKERIKKLLEKEIEKIRKFHTTKKVSKK